MTLAYRIILSTGILDDCAVSQDNEAVCDGRLSFGAQLDLSPFAVVGGDTERK